MSEDGLLSESRDPGPVRRDRTSEECFEPLAEIIAGELLAGGPVGDRLATADGARGVGELIAAAVLDRFVVRRRPAERVHDDVRRARPAGSGVILEVRDLSVVYGAKTAVDGISLQMTRGEIFGLLGPNGAGKTSTLSAIEGLIKPRSGAVLLDGVDIRRHPSQAKARLGVQLQATSFQSQLTIKQIVRLYAGLYGVRLADGEITAGLQQIGLDGDATKPFKQLSGGQQQRLSLYVAVVHDPALLLLDEPTAGLDPQSRRQLWGRIEHIRAQGGSILLTTHSMEEAEAVCDRVAIIDHGTLLTCETPRNLIAKHKDDPEVRKVAHGEVTLEDVFIGLTGSEIRE
ncbi:MAG: ABC transporter ATP-binding protein [Solirubrobacteraceae bacterium]